MFCGPITCLRVCFTYLGNYLAVWGVKKLWKLTTFWQWASPALIFSLSWAKCSLLCLVLHVHQLCFLYVLVRFWPMSSKIFFLQSQIKISGIKYCRWKGIFTVRDVIFLHDMEYWTSRNERGYLFLQLLDEVVVVGCVAKISLTMLYLYVITCLWKVLQKKIGSPYFILTVRFEMAVYK